ncbi:unnamed protein product [Caenorhabditis auriculariae]|uniref:ascorbate ferrireductase (transmembrane) n=1 Tax=Caenorhabditis auriculariae TaxID=2777116 RepID=A0A8S1HEX0_9PELO|nr:unnamed protein product [Caenorhabditis auriculariae]
MDPPVTHTQKLLMAHGILMTFAFSVFMSTGILFARHFRHHWPSTPIMGIKIWFHLHRTINLIGIAASICGFAIIFVVNDWQWVGPSPSRTSVENRRWGSVHSMLGLLACVVAWAQPIIAVFRCHPGDRTRFIFNWIHRFLGFGALLMAAAATMIACKHFELFTNHDAAFGLYITFLVVYGVVLIAMEMLSVRRWWKNRKRVSEIEMSHLGASGRTEPIEYVDDDDNSRTNTLLLLLMAFHLIVAIGVAVAISVIIAKKK